MSIIQQEQPLTDTLTITFNKGIGAGLSVTAVKRKREGDIRPTANVLKDIQLNCNLTMNGVKKLSKSLRIVNKKIIPSNATKSLQKDK